jgi:hypothetical protein
MSLLAHVSAPAPGDPPGLALETEANVPVEIKFERWQM